MCDLCLLELADGERGHMITEMMLMMVMVMPLLLQ